MTRWIGQVALGAVILFGSLTGIAVAVGKGISSDEIIFGSNRDPHDWEIFTVDIHLGIIINLTHDDVAESDAIWSPDGQRIALWLAENNDNADRGHIYIMDANGKNRRQLAPDMPNSRSPIWSPDGSTIVFSTYIGTTTQQIFAINVSSGELVQLTSDLSSSNWLPEWSCDGKWIRYQTLDNSGQRTYTMGIDGQDKHPIPYSETDCYRSTLQPRPAPDGQHIVFQHDYQIYIANVDGSDPHSLTDNQFGYWSPSWRPRHD